MEFNEWRSHPITQQFFGYLTQKKSDLKDLWASGGLAGPTMEETVIQNAAAQGAVSILDEILSLDSNSFSEVSQ